MGRGHTECPPVLNQSSPAAALFVVGDVVHRIEIGVLAAPAQRVRNRQRRDRAGHGEERQERDAPPYFAVTAKNLEHHDGRRDHGHGCRRGEPSPSRSRENENRGQERQPE